MINIPLLLAFIAAATVLTMTPGVDTAMVLRTVVTGGRRSAMLAAIGIALGCLIWGAAVSLGLGVLLQASEIAYSIIKFAGAAYLFWLGGKLLLQPRTDLESDADQSTALSGRAAFQRGFVTNILNPKVGIFYVTFLPQFVPTGIAIGKYSFFLACIHVLLTLVWFSLLIAATASLGKVLRRPAAVKALDRLTGGIFVAFGIKLAVSSAHH